jgi:hypothetical protein
MEAYVIFSTSEVYAINHVFAFLNEKRSMNSFICGQNFVDYQFTKKRLSQTAPQFRFLFEDFSDQVFK